MGEQVTIDISTAFVRAVNIQPDRARRSIHGEITVPTPLLEREARVQGMTPDEWMRNFEAVWYYGAFQGSYIIFQHKTEKNKGEASSQPG